jgi:hypothetical protein
MLPHSPASRVFLVWSGKPKVRLIPKRRSTAFLLSVERHWLCVVSAFRHCPKWLNWGLFIEPKISVSFSPQLVTVRNTRRHLSKMVSNIILPSTPASTKGRLPPKLLRPTYLPLQTNSAAGWMVSPLLGLCLVNYKEFCYVRLTAGCIADMLTIPNF